MPAVLGMVLGALGVAAVLGSELAAPGVPGAGLGSLGMAGVPGVVDERLEGGAAPRPTSGSVGIPGVGAGTPAGRTSASSCPLVNLMP